MGILKLIIKIIIILAALGLMSLPFISEHLTFNSDKKKGISYKRFRIVVYTVVYALVITLVLCIFKDLLLWFQNLSFVEWISDKVSLPGRVGYTVKLISIILVNTLIGALFVFLQKFVRIGLKKLDLVNPKKKDGDYSLSQKIQRKVIKFFFNETWFFVAKVLKHFNSVLSGIYLLIFAAYMLPMMFSLPNFLYGIIDALFNGGYVYPTITLLILWQAYYFLEGISRADKECPDLLKEDAGNLKKADEDIDKIDKESRKCFEDYFSCAVKRTATENDTV